MTSPLSRSIALSFSCLLLALATPDLVASGPFASHVPNVSPAVRAGSVADTTDGTWGVLVGEPQPAVAPGRRYGHGAIYDPVGDRMVVFGGFWLEGAILNDVWELPLSGAPEWRAMTPDGTAPPVRFLHSAIYDAARGRMIVFGGMSYATLFDDVWALSLSDTMTWTRLVPTGTPPPARFAHTAIYDPARDRMVVFGGDTWFEEMVGDAWALSLGDAPVWTQIALPPCSTPADCPGPRRYHAAIHDAPGDRMLLYGGEHDSFHDGDEFWALTLSDAPVWIPLPRSQGDDWRTSRVGHSAIRDPVRNRMVVFGGHDLLTDGDLNSTVAVSLGESPSWTWLAPGGSPPLSRMWHTAVYDPVRDRMVVFGGGGYFEDTPGATWALTWGEPLVPVQLTLVSVEAEPGLVRLTWYAASGAVRARVQRRTEATAWTSLGEIAADGTGQLVYEDRAVAPGARYGYRLGVTEGGAETFVGEAWVDVPRAAQLALVGARPNPATAELSVAFTLRDAAPARLEAYDLAGRRVAARDVGALGPGHHLVELGEGKVLGSGVYVVRLTQGGRTLTTRAVVVR